MSIINLQRRLREAGRIRLGETKATSSGKTRPSKLETFRFTSPDRSALESIAAEYGGVVGVWDGAAVGKQFELYTEATSIDVIVPPVDVVFSQFMELWKGGGCERRCDGQTNLITDKPCVCDPDNMECKPTTRLGVIVTAVSGIGIFRLETHGWNAAQELLGTIDVLRAVQSTGTMVPARLMLHQRQSKKGGQTFNYAVPGLDLRLNAAALTSASARHAELTTGATPIQTDGSPAPTILEQVEAMAVPTPTKPRKNAAPVLPATGIKPPAPRSAPVDVVDVEDETTERVAEIFGSGVIDVTVEPPKKANGTKYKAPPKTKADKTEGGATSSSLRTLMALARGKFKDDRDARIAWAREILFISPKTEISFTKLNQDQIDELTKELRNPGDPGPEEKLFPGEDPERPF